MPGGGFLRALLPRVTGSVVGLAAGLAVGSLAGLSLAAGAPRWAPLIGGVALACLLGERGPRSTPAFLSFFGALAVFEQLGWEAGPGAAPGGSPGEAVLNALLMATYASLTGLLAGWGVGAGMGLLARPLRRAGGQGQRLARRGTGGASPPPGPGIDLRPLREAFGLGPDLAVAEVRVAPGSPAAGQRLEALHLQDALGVRVLGMRRRQGVLEAPRGEQALSAGDTVLLLVPLTRASRVAELFTRPREGASPPSGVEDKGGGPGRGEGEEARGGERPFIMERGPEEV